MSCQRLFKVNADGDLRNVGRDFKSYDFPTVEKCVNVLSDNSVSSYKINLRKLGQRSGGYQWDRDSVLVFAEQTPNAHQAVLRLLRIADCDTIEGHCFVVAECGWPHGSIRGVFQSVAKLDRYLASVPREIAVDLIVRIVAIDSPLE